MPGSPADSSIPEMHLGVRGDVMGREQMPEAACWRCSCRNFTQSSWRTPRCLAPDTERDTPSRLDFLPGAAKPTSLNLSLQPEGITSPCDIPGPGSLRASELPLYNNVSPTHQLYWELWVLSSESGQQDKTGSKRELWGKPQVTQEETVEMLGS